MNLRLDFELLLRRHGRPLVVVLAATAAVLLAAALAVARAYLAPPATVAATDGGRQLEDRLRAFRSVLIPRAELDSRQRGVLDEALRRGLTPGRIDYGLEANAAGRFGVATLQLVLRGSYADFRGFLAAVLAGHPAIALDDLAIERAKDSGIEARLRLAFHTEADAAVREVQP
jgi:Tfp pilus assembly protein PilO